MPEGFTQTVIEQQPNFPDLSDMNQMNERSIPIAKTAEDDDEYDDDEAKKARPGHASFIELMRYVRVPQ